jgi:hypothetical protein
MIIFVQACFQQNSKQLKLPSIPYFKSKYKKKTRFNGRIPITWHDQLLNKHKQMNVLCVLVPHWAS